VWLRATLAVAAAVAGATAARADIVLDDFTDPSTAVIRSRTGLPSDNTSDVVTNLPGGTTRTVSFALAGPGTFSGQVGAGVLGVDLGFSSAATVGINYAFGSATNFVPNVAAGGTPGAIVITGSSQTDLDFKPTAFTLNLTTESGTFTATGTLNSSSATTSIDLAGLSGVGDLTQVTGLSLTVNAGRAADFIIDSIALTTPDAPPPTNAVPAPPAALLALAAIPALGLRRAVRRKAA
jgi:hypothetical protein